MHLALGGGHGLADRIPLRLQILFPEGDIVQGEDLTGDSGCQGVGGELTGGKAQLRYHIQQGLAGPGLHGIAVDEKLHEIASFFRIL